MTIYLSDVPRVTRKVESLFKTDALKLELFRDEIERAKLLLVRLNDDPDMHLGITRVFLLRVPTSALDAVRNLWGAYYCMQARVDKYAADGWELNEYWKWQLQAACEHIQFRCEPWLSADQAHELSVEIKGLYLEALSKNK